jgi:hypothetical protein
MDVCTLRSCRGCSPDGAKANIRDRRCKLLSRSRISLAAQSGLQRLQRLRSKALRSKANRPLFRLRARGSPSFLSTSVSLAIEGVGAPTRRSARIAPGGLSGLLRTMRCTCDAPRASRRANEHLRAYALPTARTDQDLFVPGRFARAPPVGKVASTSPAGALPLPAVKTPHECAPRRVDRDGRSIVTLQVKSSTISL